MQKITAPPKNDPNMPLNSQQSDSKKIKPSNKQIQKTNFNKKTTRRKRLIFKETETKSEKTKSVHPPEMTHSADPPEMTKSATIFQKLFKFSLEILNADDLVSEVASFF